MKRDINLLLPPKQVVRLDKVTKYLTRITVVFLVLFIVVVLILIGVNSIILSKTKSLESEIDRAQSVIDQKREVEKKYVILTKRLDYADKIIQQRFPYGEIVKKINNLVPSGVVINSLSIKEKSGINMEGVSDSPESLDEFTKKMLTDDLLSTYTLSLTSTERNSDGSYNVTFSLEKSSNSENEQKNSGVDEKVDTVNGNMEKGL